MNKYKLAQTLYWIKYIDHMPEINWFTVACVKQTEDGYKYGNNVRGPSVWVKEHQCFASGREAVDGNKQFLEELL